MNIYVKDFVGSYQCGFRKGKSTTDHIFVVSDGQILWIQLHLLFIDFRQSYDSISRNELWKGLELHGIPSNVARW